MKLDDPGPRPLPRRARAEVDVRRRRRRRRRLRAGRPRPRRLPAQDRRLQRARRRIPTRWRVRVHTGPDFLERFAADARGGVVVIAGSNARKTEYLTRAVAAGYHTLADKPMAIDADGFAALETAFGLARERGVLLYDIMTERHEITTILQKAFSRIAPVFGTLEAGTLEDPAVTKESVHHFSKLVSGVPIKRPAWFFDTAQQGEGPRRHHDAPRRPRAVGVLPGRDARLPPRRSRAVGAALAHGDHAGAVRAGDATRRVPGVPAQGRAARRQPARVRERRDPLCASWRAREGLRAVELRGARRRGRHALFRHARDAREPRDPAGCGRGLAAHAVHRAACDAGPDRVRGGARRRAAGRAARVPGRRARNPQATAGASTSRRRITSGTRRTSRR